MNPKTTTRAYAARITTNRKTTMKILLPAHQIPDGSTVTKRTGTQKYTLIRSIKVYAKADRPNDRVDVAAEDGVVFLASQSSSQAGKFNAYPGNTELIWFCTNHDLRTILDNLDYDNGK